ncbi:GntR family transcriptional regulator [Streptomyces sp. 8K308]|uniref:GntR family transcriptional regulator n=1 Tax=Streptomyces sp. 8K308 TaxID=2530388 RepID=UPI001044AAAB|nr:GntR family transcriptional regulator [Streptomyces sp. 8K308]
MTQSSSPGRQALELADPRLPLHAKLREEFIGRIRSAEWTPAEPIPPESALAGFYGVSVGTVRRVMGELVDQGLLERRQGDGTYVRRVRLDRALHRFFRHGTAGDTLPDSRIMLREVRNVEAAVAHVLRIAPESQVLYLKRVRSREGDPLLVEDIWLPLPRFEAIARAGLDELGNLLYPAYEELAGQIVGGAREELTVERCGSATAELLGCAEDEPVVVIERIARAHDDTPLERRVTRGRANTFRYRVELT